MNHLEKEIRYIPRKSQEYPSVLKQYERMPEGLYVIGSLPDPDRRSVSIVGARSCSEYGRSQAAAFAKKLAAAGVQIISGMALGIDCAAHTGALETSGTTFAVLGCGPDICYPASKIRLYRQIISSGGILSEFEPGTPAMAHHFPIRNRIISGLADAVVVVEARRKSGSLITAFHALEQNKTVYALPGRICDSLSEGTNELICQGAIPAVSPEQILLDLGIAGSGEKKTQKKTDGLNPEEKQLLSCVGSDPKTLETLHLESGLPVRETGIILTKLQLWDLVREAAPGLFVAG